MLVVADTSPINYLVLLEHTAVLPALYTCSELITSAALLDYIAPVFVLFENEPAPDRVLCTLHHHKAT